MVTDGQVKELRRLLDQGKTLATAARMTEMSEKTARSYRDDDSLPSQRKKPRTYRTRVDPFADVWHEVQARLEDEPRLKAKTLFDWLQQQYPGKFPDSTRRTFERRVAKWRSIHGPAKTVFFAQQHHAGRLAASDFTVCNDLGVRIAGARFDHSLFHCVLTYSNVESVSLCFSESFEALSEGIQKAFWEFGGVPQRHRTDSLSAAVRNHASRKTLTDRYAALMDHYGCQGERTNARCANENGDVESSHGHLKDRIDQALLLRGSRDFASREDYLSFVEQIVARANANRRGRFLEEQASLRRLPPHRLDTDDFLTGISVSRSSTIQVRTNAYSVPSRLIGRKVDVRIGAEQIVVSHQGHHVQTMGRLFGKKGKSINYRHIIDSLVRKPGAFANYQYREEMFPTSQFRIAYDVLREAHSEKVADKIYVQILELAARESEEAVIDALRLAIASGETIRVAQIRSMVADAANLPPATDLEVESPDLTDFDSLLHTFDKESLCDDKNDPQESTPVRSQCGPGSATDRSVSRASTTELPGSLPTVGDAGCDGESQPPGLSLGTDDAGVRGTPGRSNSTVDETVETAAGQELGLVRLETITAGGEATAGNLARRIVPGSPRERSLIRQTGFGEKSRDLRIGRAPDPPRSQHAIHDLQLAGPATADRQARPATAEIHQATVDVRGADHRRSGLCATEPRGNGGVVHPAGRALRTGQRAVDEQPGVQQVGSNLQGRHDHRSGDRPLGPSQCDHRAERAELPSGNGEENEISSNQECQIKFVMGNSNCR
jgi:hypothetical protein